MIHEFLYKQKILSISFQCRSSNFDMDNSNNGQQEYPNRCGFHYIKNENNVGNTLLLFVNQQAKI
jgi:hypothetical protein